MSGPAEYGIAISPAARRDLSEIVRYMAEVRGRDDADALLTAITGRLDQLRTFPSRGGVPK